MNILGLLTEVGSSVSPRPLSSRIRQIASGRSHQADRIRRTRPRHSTSRCAHVRSFAYPGHSKSARMHTLHTHHLYISAKIQQRHTAPNSCRSNRSFLRVCFNGGGGGSSAAAVAANCIILNIIIIPLSLPGPRATISDL